MKDYEIILDQINKEIEMISECIEKNKAVSVQETEKLDKLYHLKKSMLTCRAMEEAEGSRDGWDTEEGNSGRRGRNPVNGRYVSRDHGMDAQSYSDGYSQGYSEAMKQMGNGGHYPAGSYPPIRW